jgi:hypothetical protein
MVGDCPAPYCATGTGATYCEEDPSVDYVCTGKDEAACDASAVCAFFGPRCDTLPFGPLDCAALPKPACESEAAHGCVFSTAPTCVATGALARCDSLDAEATCAASPGCTWDAPAACGGNTPPVLAALDFTVDEQTLSVHVRYADAEGQAPLSTRPLLSLARGESVLAEAVMSATGSEPSFASGVDFAYTMPGSFLGQLDNVCIVVADAHGAAAEPLCADIPFDRVAIGQLRAINGGEASCAASETSGAVWLLALCRCVLRGARRRSPARR